MNAAQSHAIGAEREQAEAYFSDLLSYRWALVMNILCIFNAEFRIAQDFLP